MTVGEFYENLCELYPKSLSCEWDNDGLMCCMDKNRKVEKVLVALDATKESLTYAANNGFDTVLVHHPLIFKAVKSVNEDTVVGNRTLLALRNELSVISLHTRLDCGAGGVNDTLAEILGLENIKAFGDDENPDFGRIGETSLSSPADFANRIKKATGAEKITGYICKDVKKVAVVGGSAGEFFACAKAAGADTLVTGECKYHEGLDAKEYGMNIFAAGHYFSEFPVTQTLCRLAENMTGAKTEIFTPVPEITY